MDGWVFVLFFVFVFFFLDVMGRRRGGGGGEGCGFERHSQAVETNDG